MLKLIITILIIVLAVHLTDPGFFNEKIEDAKAVAGIKAGQAKEAVVDLDTVELAGKKAVSVGGITRECINDDECNSHNSQCENNCFCQEGSCYKFI